MKKCLIIILLVCCTITLKAQENDSFEKVSFIKAGSGFIGLLYLDELASGDQFGREALPPVSASFEWRFKPRLSLGYYFGYEYEKLSGTTVGFEGPNHSIVTGVNMNFHFLRYQNLNWFDPYIGLSLYYYSFELLTRNGFSPAYRIGSNFYINEKWGANLNIGVGAALIEFSVMYKLNSQPGRDKLD